MDTKLIEMYNFYKQGKTLKEIGVLYNISFQNASYLFKKNNMELRKRGTGIKKSIINTIDDTAIKQEKTKWDCLPTTVKGTISETYVKNVLLKLEYDVWEPVSQNHKVDLCILKNDKIIKIQVKTASYDIKKKRFRTLLKCHGDKGKHSVYKKDETDFFIIFCPLLPELEFYVIPAELGIKTPGINLLPHRDIYKRKNILGWEKYKNAFDLIV